MIAGVDATQRDNLIGSLWMVAAMAGFSVEDALLKQAAVSLPLAQVMVLFGAGGAGLFALWAALTRARLIRPEILSASMRIRALFEICGRLFYTLAIVLTPLSSATAILQATPIVVVAGAALVFGEPVGWRRWTAIALGLSGVLIVLQPGGGSFTPLSILAVLGMLGFAGRDLASRAAPAALSTPVLGVYGFLAIIVAGGLYAALWERAAFVWPTAGAATALACAIGIGVFAYGALMRAMRTGEVSAVTPFRYTRLVFGVALGVLWFGEALAPSMLLGCALIVAAGLYILWRGQRRG